MESPLAEALGPPPFRFAPSAAVLRSPAYSVPFRVLATLLVFGATGWGLSLWQSGKLPFATWFLAALALMLYTWWCIVRSTTTLDATALRQTWMWEKRMELRELAYARVIRVRGLEWLIAPRIYVRTLLGKFAVFYAADLAIVSEFDRLAAELAAFRAPR